MATTYKTSGEGAFTFVGKTYKIAGDSDGVTFYLDDDGNVYAVKNLDGVIVADFEGGFTVNGELIQVTGDKNNSVSVTATADGVSEIGGVNGDEVSVVNFGSANTILATSSGTFTIDATTFTITDKSGALFELTNGKVTGVSDLDGELTADFSDGLNVNGTAIKIIGGDVVVNVKDGAIFATTTAEGTFTIGKRTFTVTNSATFEIDSDGVVTGVTNLIGDISFKSNGLAFSVNGTPLTIGVNDEVTISTDENGNITGVSNFDTYIIGAPANTTIGATDKNVTVNGTAISITDSSYVLTLDSAGNPTQASALSNGAVVNNIPANMQLVTDENGNFRIGNRSYTISGNDTGVIFSTDEGGKVTGVSDLDGAICVQGDVTLNVNGYEVAIDKVVSAGDAISIYGGADGIYNVYGLANGDTVNGDLNGAAISMPADSTLYINNRTFQLSNDSDGVIIIPAQTSTAIKYLSAGATFIVDSGGTYLVTNDDDETVTLNLDGAATILSDSDGVISAYTNTDFTIDSNSDLNTIINAISEQPNNYINLKTPLTTFDLDVNYNLNLVFYLNNAASTVAPYDFSGTSYRKRVSLAGGNQNLTMNGAGDNIIVVTENSTGNKNIVLGAGGDNLVIEESAAAVTVTANGAADIVTKSDISVIAATSNAKITPLNNSSVNLQNYYINAFNAGFGVQTALTDILKAVKIESISFSDFNASVTAYGSFYFDSYNFANFYNKFSQVSKVAWNAGAGVDAANFSDDLIILGNYFNSVGGGSIFGGSGNDTILAGDFDTVNAGDGDNFIEFNLNHLNSATIFKTSKNSNDTVKNFRFGTDSTADIIQTEGFYVDGMTLSENDVVLDLRNGGSLTLKDAVNNSALIENDYVDNPVPVQFGNQNLTVNGAVEYYWAGGADATVTVGNYYADSLSIDLNNSKFQDRQNLRFNGDIKVVDASSFKGFAQIFGNSNSNIITAAVNNSTINGGAGNFFFTAA